MSDIGEIGDIIKRAIEAEKGSPFGIANLAALAVLAIAVTADSLQTAIVFIAIHFGRGVLYVFDRVMEFLYRRRGFTWLPRDEARSPVPTPGSIRTLSWLLFLGVFCPAGLLLQQVA